MSEVAELVGVVEDGIRISLHPAVFPQVGQQTTNVFDEIIRQCLIVASVKRLAQSIPKVKAYLSNFELGMVHTEEQQVECS